MSVIPRKVVSSTRRAAIVPVVQIRHYRNGAKNIWVRINCATFVCRSVSSLGKIFGGRGHRRMFPMEGLGLLLSAPGVAHRTHLMGVETLAMRVTGDC